ncbi:MAG TPA: helix-turn-helix domain-containing protein [Terriglobia bacterium]|nr:helix-turn-helix domain-containing protein [Terriglobia bacterium]
MSTAVANPANYGKLLAKMRPHPIHSEEDCDRAIETIAKLMERGEDNLSPEETSLLEMMSILVERYEQERYPMEPSKPGEMIQFLMEQRRLQQRDLARALGSKSHVSEILSGKRDPSKEQAKKLAAFFNVSPALFI